MQVKEKKIKYPIHLISQLENISFVLIYCARTHLRHQAPKVDKIALVAILMNSS